MGMIFPPVPGKVLEDIQQRTTLGLRLHVQDSGAGEETNPMIYSSPSLAEGCSVCGHSNFFKVGQARALRLHDSLRGISLRMSRIEAYLSHD
jgi:hypothetical protein